MHAVGIIFEDQEGNILILKRHPKSIEGNTWGLVGGSVDPGESTVAAAVRETKEETGINIETNLLRHLKSYQWNRDSSTLHFETFHYRVIERPKILLDQEENIQYEWVRPENAYPRSDLMDGLYKILEDQYDLKST